MNSFRQQVFLILQKLCFPCFLVIMKVIKIFGSYFLFFQERFMRLGKQVVRLFDIDANLLLENRKDKGVLVQHLQYYQISKTSAAVCNINLCLAVVWQLCFTIVLLGLKFMRVHTLLFLRYSLFFLAHLSTKCCLAFQDCWTSSIKKHSCQLVGESGQGEWIALTVVCFGK